MTDRELTVRLRGGDASAFDALVERHYPTCLRFAWRQLGQREDAEEAVHDALLRAHAALLRGSEPANFRAWLMAILVNRCRSYRGRNRRRLALLDRFRAVVPEPVRESAAPADAVLDPAAPVARMLQRLSPRLREAFLLRHLEELSYQEMATATGVRQSALKMRVKRATELLARMLVEEEDRRD